MPQWGTKYFFSLVDGYGVIQAEEKPEIYFLWPTKFHPEYPLIVSFLLVNRSLLKLESTIDLQAHNTLTEFSCENQWLYSYLRR